jgi:hypothetical protein
MAESTPWSSWKAVIASSAARRQRQQNGTATATGRWTASLVSNARGVLVNRQAETREAAVAAGMQLLDDAAGFAWLHGETISVAISAAVG